MLTNIYIQYFYENLCITDTEMAGYNSRKDDHGLKTSIAGMWFSRCYQTTAPLTADYPGRSFSPTNSLYRVIPGPSQCKRRLQLWAWRWKRYNNEMFGRIGEDDCSFFKTNEWKVITVDWQRLLLKHPVAEGGCHEMASFHWNRRTAELRKMTKYWE